MDVADEIAKALSEYSEEVAENLEAIKKEVAKDTVEMLKSTSPRGRKGKYAKGWRMKKDGTGYYVHNATDYRLTHLLEHGHAKANGGRTKAQPHIAQAEREAIEKIGVRIQT